MFHQIMHVLFADFKDDQWTMDQNKLNTPLSFVTWAVKLWNNESKMVRGIEEFKQVTMTSIETIDHDQTTLGMANPFT